MSLCLADEWLAGVRVVASNRALFPRSSWSDGNRFFGSVELLSVIEGGVQLGRSSL